MIYKYDNILAIHAPTRCGSTSMSTYLGFKEDKTDVPPPQENFPSLDINYNILVLRNPYGRLQSSITYCDTVAHSSSEMILYGDYGTFVDWVYGHSNLFLYRFIKTANPRFYFIDFNRLSEYIPMSSATASFNTKDEVWKDRFSEFYSKEQMQREYEGYCHVKDNWRELEPHTWKVLTKSLSGVKLTALK